MMSLAVQFTHPARARFAPARPVPAKASMYVERRCIGKHIGFMFVCFDAWSECCAAGTGRVGYCVFCALVQSAARAATAVGREGGKRGRSHGAARAASLA